MSESKNTDARRRAAKKYLTESVEDIRIRVQKGRKQEIKDFAESKNKSLNQFVVDAIDDAMRGSPGSGLPIGESDSTNTD